MQKSKKNSTCRHTGPARPVKKKTIIGSLLFIPLACSILFNMPLVIAKGNPGAMSAQKSSITEMPVMHGADLSAINRDNNNITVAYESMHLKELGLSKQTFDYAIKGYQYLVQEGKLAKENIISIVDFGLPSSKKRLFVIDLNENELLFNTYVAHGVNSGKEYARDFSNNPSSYKSSLGFYETLSTYSGGHGYSLKLEGLEKGINDNANRRAIVIHAAAYVNEALIKTQGYIGRSWGCPALPENLYRPIIDKIKDGTCLFIYSPDNAYLQGSKIINA